MTEIRELTLWEMLVWSYRDQRVDDLTGRSLHAIEAAADGVHRRQRSRDGVARLQEIGALGAYVAGTTGSWGGSAECHPDAELLHDTVLALGKRNWLGALAIMQHARMGERPERNTAIPVPGPAPPNRRTDEYERARIAGRLVDVKVCVAERVREAVPVLDGRGRRKYRIVHGEKVAEAEAGPMHEVRYCPLEWNPPLEIIDIENGTLRLFEEAMEQLAAMLAATRFRNHRIADRAGMASSPQPRRIVENAEIQSGHPANARKSGMIGRRRGGISARHGKRA